MYNATNELLDANPLRSTLAYMCSRLFSIMLFPIMLSKGSEGAKETEMVEASRI